MAIKDHRMMLVRTLRAALLAVVFSFSSTGAFAASITIANYDFSEGPDIIDAVVPPTGDTMFPSWESYRPAGTEGSGQWYTRKSTTGVNLTTQAEVAYIDLKSGGQEDPGCHPVCDDGEYPVGIQQFLDPLLQANSLYTLSVLVGNPKSGGGLDYSNFGGYRIELLAGTNVIGSDDNSKAIAEGNFETSDFSVLSNDLDVGLIGLALGIRLIHKNSVKNPDPRPANFNWGIAFDDVSLTVSAVPVPAAVWLFGTALLGLFGFGKRRKTA